MGVLAAPPAQAAMEVQAVVYLQAYLLPQLHQQAYNRLSNLHLPI